MTSIQTVITIFCVLLATTLSTAQTIPLNNSWKFNVGDQSDWKNSDFNDAHWNKISISANWESQGYPDLNGFAWYRTSFDLSPEQLREDWVLLAGIIDDADETYINGVLVGSTGKFPPNDQSAWDTQRKYTLPKGILLAHNTLAIRVYDGTGGGGIYAGRMELITQKQFNHERQLLLQKKQSWHQLTTSNGLIAAVYNAASHQVETVYPHIFSAYDSAQLVAPFVRNIAPDIAEKPTKVEYQANTHVIETQYQHFSIFYTASFTASDKVFYVVVRGKPEVISSLKFRHESGDEAQLFTRTFTVQRGKIMEKYFLYGFTDRFHPTVDLAQTEKRLRAEQTSIIETETEFMEQVFSRCRFPKGISRQQKSLMKQSIAVLKMAQVADNEVFPLSKGQILAGLRPGVWAISWVRDGAFAINALTTMGLLEEAKKGLAFMLNAAPSGQYVHYRHTDGKDYGISVDYQISVTRYFGNSREESDYADTRGPNIEIDDFGLFLDALCDYVTASGDTAFFRQWQSVLQTKVADPILHNINEQGIIRADSGPWEHHLPGRSFAFTSAVCGVGLQKFAQIQQQLGYPAQSYFNGADQLYRGVMLTMLYENRLIKGNAQDQSPTDHYFFDGATFELFAGGFINEKSLFLSHIAAYNQELQVKNKDKTGYIRFNSSDSYENQEWPFASMRVAVAQNKFGNPKEARRLLARITDLAAHNYYLIPEIVTIEDNSYRGSIPMAGYGAGAYLITMRALYK